jgi:hypothetical protein
MNTATRIPEVRPPRSSMAKGLSQLRLGATEPSTSPNQTRPRATTENRIRVVISAPSRKYWVLAEASMPT